MPRRSSARATPDHIERDPSTPPTANGLVQNELVPLLNTYLTEMADYHRKAVESHDAARDHADAVRLESELLEARLMKKIDAQRAYIERLADALAKRTNATLPRAEELDDAEADTGSVGSAGHGVGAGERARLGAGERDAFDEFDAYGYVRDPNDLSKREKECWRVVDKAWAKREGMAVAKKLLGGKSRGFNFSRNSAYYRCVEHEGCECVYRVRKKSHWYEQEFWYVAKKNYRAHEELMAQREAGNAS